MKTALPVSVTVEVVPLGEVPITVCGLETTDSAPEMDSLADVVAVVLVVLVAARPSVAVTAVNAIIATNAVWTAASVLLLVSGWVSPTVLGVAFVLAQALAVGAFAVIQYVCLRQAGSGVPA